MFPRIDCNLFTFSISEYIFILTAVIDIQNRDIGIFPPCPDFYQGCFFYFAERFFLLISTIIVAIPPPLMSKAIIHGQTFALSPVFGLVLESELPFPLRPGFHRKAETETSGLCDDAQRKVFAFRKYTKG